MGVEEALNRWTDTETLLFAEAYSNISKDFKSIAEYIGTKNQFQCKEYYHNHRSRLGLDEAHEKTSRRVRPTPLFWFLTSVRADIWLQAYAAQEEANGEKKVAANWTAAEKGEFLKYFTVYGKNWKMLAQFIPTKERAQVRLHTPCQY